MEDKKYNELFTMLNRIQIHCEHVANKFDRYKRTLPVVNSNMNSFFDSVIEMYDNLNKNIENMVETNKKIPIDSRYYRDYKYFFSKILEAINKCISAYKEIYTILKTAYLSGVYNNVEADNNVDEENDSEPTTIKERSEHTEFNEIFQTETMILFKHFYTTYNPRHFDPHVPAYESRKRASSPPRGSPLPPPPPPPPPYKPIMQTSGPRGRASSRPRSMAPPRLPVPAPAPPPPPPPVLENTGGIWKSVANLGKRCYGALCPSRRARADGRVRAPFLAPVLGGSRRTRKTMKRRRTK
jgi:hypothetical protein